MSVKTLAYCHTHIAAGWLHYATRMLHVTRHYIGGYAMAQYYVGYAVITHYIG